MSTDDVKANSSPAIEGASPHRTFCVRELANADGGLRIAVYESPFVVTDWIGFL